jgi:adenosylcobyric acid synthase
VAGLGLLNVHTQMQPEKTVRLSSASSALFGTPLDGYEIHLGETTGPDCARPFARIGDKADGAVSADGRICGTYLHGLFGNDMFRKAYLQSAGMNAEDGSHAEKVDAALDEIAVEIDALGLGAIINRAR